jgi:hypothetical protein
MTEELKFGSNFKNHWVGWRVSDVPSSCTYLTVTVRKNECKHCYGGTPLSITVELIVSSDKLVSP